MVPGRGKSKSYAGRTALVGVAVTVALLGAAAPAAAVPGSASGSATGSAQLATGSASGSADTAAARAYLTWQSAQFIHNTLRMLLAVPMRLG